jgi:hypothetical protein
MKKITKAQMNSMKSMGGAEYARQEAWDVQQASQALSMIAQMVHNEVDEPMDMMTLADIMFSLVEFIKGEIKEMESAATQGENYAKSIPAVVKTQEPTLNLSYAKSLNIETLPDMAVKYVALDQIKGYTYLWGNPTVTDIEMEYFTKDTNFWDETLGKSPRPLTWDHAQDDSLKAHPVIGQITDFGDDEIGRWYVAKLDRSHKYRKAIDALIEAGKLGTSSDSASQYVQRVKTGKSTWLKEWPWFASALTDTPAEPRMIDSLEFYKSLGITLPETPRKAWEWNQRRLQLSRLIK